MRCGVDTLTSTPHSSLNIHSFFGLLTRATTRGHAELLLGQQRHDEVVLVVAGDGGDDVGPLDAGRGERVDLAGVAVVPRHADRLAGAPGLGDDRLVVVEDRHVVTGAVQLLGDEPADAAATGDDHVHVSAPSSRGACQRVVDRLEPARSRRRRTARRRPGRPCGPSGSSPHPSG